jgi:hypothetical protein
MASTHRPNRRNGGDPAKRMRRTRAPGEPLAPKQGYEPEDELELGTSVSPPSAGELAESVVDICAELTTAGLSAAGRLLKDALSPLRGP